MEPSTNSFQKVRSQNDARTQTVVGFEDDSRRLVEQLMRGKKQLQFISVFGMAGLGKTTLVKKVFNEPSVVYHFYVRAWTTVTQEPNKRDLLLGILKSGLNVEIGNCSDMELSETVKRSLSGQRYLVVMDDIWDSKDWNDLMLSFPDDNVGSRIVFTTRLADVPLQVQPGCYQHPLRFLNEKESWELLRYKVFLEDPCPSSLIDIGVNIARRCKGLPLSIVVIAGILASDTTVKWWSQLAQEMISITSNAPEQYMETLVLSYNHLPDHLKPCFLYFAAFPEDYEIPAWRLTLLWIAEGFIKVQTAENNLEDGKNSMEEVAAGYLMDLITRSLVIVSRWKSNGGIKACIVHDVLHDLCIKKAGEVNFSHQIPRQLQPSVPVTQTPAMTIVQRLYTREVDEENFISQLKRYFHLETPFTLLVDRLYRCCGSYKRSHNISTKNLYPNVQTILCYEKPNQTKYTQFGSGNPFANASHSVYYLFNILRVFKYLRVMDLYSIQLSYIPVVIGSLLELRYIAVCIKARHSNINLQLPASVLQLKYLETLIVHNKNSEDIFVPEEIWMLRRMRHLFLKGNMLDLHTEHPNGPNPSVKLQTLPYLQTLSHRISLKQWEKILEITPNLRRLRINAGLYLSSPKLTITNLSNLQHLENLSLQNDLLSGIPSENLLYREISSPNMFPVTLKKLTLVCTFLKWDEMQKIGMLPNLEILKLQCDAFRGGQWETSDGAFCRLKHLAFKFIKLVQWIAYSEQFPNLQHLKLDECQQLEEIPIGIGDIYTLEMIEIRNCNRTVVQSAHEIKEDQMNKGNDMLKISIFQA